MLKVGMYVRTEYGISKIVNIFFEKAGVFIETDNGLGNCSMATGGKMHKGIYVLEEDYGTFIDNNVKDTIIDLIEVGDYVNGELVEYIDVDSYKDYVINNGYWCKQENIKTIVTHEQFEQMQYKVGE